MFTERRFAGNPLAVVLDADGLDTAAMQAIANEFNLPETVFVLPPENADTARAAASSRRRRELPFAGHPTVGTAVLLGRARRRRQSRDFVLEEQDRAGAAAGWRRREGGGERVVHAAGAAAAEAARGAGRTTAIAAGARV